MIAQYDFRLMPLDLVANLFYFSRTYEIPGIRGTPRPLYDCDRACPRGTNQLVKLLKVLLRLSRKDVHMDQYGIFTASRAFYKLHVAFSDPI